VLFSAARRKPLSHFLDARLFYAASLLFISELNTMWGCAPPT
jgi:hypothetical protein